MMFQFDLVFWGCFVLKKIVKMKGNITQDIQTDMFLYLDMVIQTDMLIQVDMVIENDMKVQVDMVIKTV